MQILLSLIGVIIGGLITWWVAHKYYQRAAVDLQAEAGKLRNLLRIVLTAMEENRQVKLNRDESGMVVGMQFERTVSDNLSDISDQVACSKNPIPPAKPMP